MIAADKDALVCDLAETYGIYDLEAVPVMTLATLSAGLHEDSRIKLRMLGYTEVALTFALVHTADSLSMILAALAGGEKPPLYYDYMVGKLKEKPQSGMTIDEFEAARARILNG